MKDVEDLLREVLAERAGDVGPDPGFAARVVTGPGARRSRRNRAVRVLAVAAAVVTGGVVAVQVVTMGGSVSVEPTLPPGRISLTPEPPPPVPRPGGCGTFAGAVPSTGSAGPGWTPTPSVNAPDADREAAAMTQPPVLDAVLHDLAQVLDWDRFAGAATEPSTGSVTVFVVDGPTADEAAEFARRCARPGASVTIRRVVRSTAQLAFLRNHLDGTLPASVRPVLFHERFAGELRRQPEAVARFDERRNRVTLWVDGPLTPQMRKDLASLYGDAVQVWRRDTRTLEEPGPAWLTG